MRSPQDGGTAHLWATDLAGSVTTMRDASGAVTAQYGYTAFGDRALTAGADVTVIGYRSEQHDAAGLIYLRARYYDPGTGQFLSVDPLVAVTLDRYGYADGNPVQIVDPLGLFTLEEWETIGFYLGVAALVAATATVTVATGGTALALLGGAAFFMGSMSLSVTALSTVDSCSRWDDESAECLTGAASVGVVWFAGLGWVDRIGKLARGGSRASAYEYTLANGATTPSSVWGQLC